MILGGMALTRGCEASQPGISDFMLRCTPVEVEKLDLERGTYQHPDLYGQPPERGMNFRPELERPSAP